MTINITNIEADRLTRQLADMEGVGLTEAVLIAVREALARRRSKETVLATAESIRQELGIVLTDEMRKPLPRKVWDEIAGDPAED